MMALLELHTHFSIHIRDRGERNAVEGAAGGAGKVLRRFISNTEKRSMHENICEA